MKHQPYANIVTHHNSHLRFPNDHARGPIIIDEVVYDVVNLFLNDYVRNVFEFLPKPRLLLLFLIMLTRHVGPLIFFSTKGGIDSRGRSHLCHC